MEISFCTTCRNRRHQFERLFDANAEIIENDEDLEWVIVNYGSDDGLDDFIQRKLAGCSQRIVYVRELSGRPWHASVAKNVAHRIGAGEFLMNLDCDNRIGDAVDVIRKLNRRAVDMIHMWSGTLGDGTCGRIASRRECFHALGGYDESFYPMGYQDFDLVRRAVGAGHCVVRSPASPDLALKNSKDDSIRNCTRDGLSWAEFNRRNRQRSLENVAHGMFVANQPLGWAMMHIETARGSSATSKRTTA